MTSPALVLYSVSERILFGFPAHTTRRKAAWHFWSSLVIYSKFGSRLTLLSRLHDNNGRLAIRASVEGVVDTRDFALADLKADAGMPEINGAVEKLPWIEQQATVRRRPK